MWHKLLAISLLLIFPIACDTVPEDTGRQVMHFSDKAPMTFDVGDIQVREDYVSPFREPNAEHLFFDPPAAAVKRWVSERMVMAGESANQLVVTIEDASVIEKKLQAEGDLFHNVPDRQYDATLKVKFELIGSDSLLPRAEAQVEVHRSMQAMSKYTVKEREELYDRLTRGLMADFDRVAEQQLRQYFAPYML